MVITSGVARTRKARQVDEGCTADVICNGLEGELQGMAEEPVRLQSNGREESKDKKGQGASASNPREVTCGLLVFGLLFGEEAGEGHDVGVNLLNRMTVDAVGSHDE